MEDFNHLNALANALASAIARVVTKTAFDIEAQAAENAPVDTGALQASIYERTYTSHDRHDKTRGKGFFPLIKQPPNQYEAYVAVGANYGIYVEMGTRRMPAQPYFYPAIEANRQPFIDAMSSLEDKLRGAI